MITKLLNGSKISTVQSDFNYWKVIETMYLYKDFLIALSVGYPWTFFDNIEERCVPLTNEEQLSYFFVQNDFDRFGKIQIEVIQLTEEWVKEKEKEKGKVVEKSK